jgi:hypothetical protein
MRDCSFDLAVCVGGSAHGAAGCAAAAFGAIQAGLCANATSLPRDAPARLPSIPFSLNTMAAEDFDMVGGAGRAGTRAAGRRCCLGERYLHDTPARLRSMQPPCLPDRLGLSLCTTHSAYTLPGPGRY